MAAWTNRSWVLLAAVYAAILTSRGKLLPDIFATKQQRSNLSCRLAIPLRVRDSRQDYGELRCNRSISGDPLRLGGALYSVGISTHANARIRFEPISTLKAPGTFSGRVGLSDYVITSGGSARASIVVDGHTRWTSRRLTPGVIDEFTLAVTPLSSLELVVSDAGDGIQFDEVTWARLKIQ